MQKLRIKWQTAMAVLLAALLVTLLPGTAMAADEPAPDTVTVGSTNFVEQLILANIYAQVLEDHGVKVNKRLNLGSREIVFPALQAGEIDILPEYSGTLLGYLSKGESKETDSQDVLKALRKVLPEGIIALEPSPAEDKDGLAVTPATAEKYGLKKFSDLIPVADKLVLGGSPEMKTRYIGLPGLAEVYGIRFKEFRSLDAGGPLTTGALNSGQVDVGFIFTTQGVIEQDGWVVLEDDKHMVSAQNLIPVLRKEVATPAISARLNEVSAALTTDDLRKMNKRVEVDHDDPDTVAADWVKAHGLDK